MIRKIDVIVIGAGFAGLSAAIEAKLKGKEVVVFEKMSKVGGNSVISDGGIAAPNTDLQKKFEVVDSIDLMVKDIMTSGEYKNNQTLVNLLGQQALDAFLWTRDYLGVEYLDRVDIFGGHSVPRCYTPLHRSGRDIIKALEKKCNELNIDIKTNVMVEHLLIEHDMVKGVKILEYEHFNKKEFGERFEYVVNDAVILTTGGYGQNIELLQEFAPKYVDLDTTNKPMTTNNLLSELRSYNAKMVDLDSVQLLPATSIDERGYGDGPLFGDYVVFPYGIVIDSINHQRYVSELSNRKNIADCMVKHPPFSYGIADQKAVDFAAWDLSKNLKKGVVKKYDTLEMLAQNIGTTKSQLQSIFDRYNKQITQGIDEDYNKPITNQMTLDTPPYYVMRMYPKIHHTMGGLAINEKAQVLNNEESPIKGLYAAGEVTGGIHGAARLGSMAVTDCLVFGRIAGRLLQ